MITKRQCIKGSGMPNSENTYLAINEVLDVPEMDEEHNELFERLENLKMHSFGSSEVLQQEADALCNCLTRHFQTEQKLADAAGIDFSEHAQLHEKMLGVVSMSLKQIYQGQGDVFALIKYIHVWFERHIQETDARFAARLHGSDALSN
jgi:hemerythrin-like metal-binding protein